MLKTVMKQSAALAISFMLSSHAVAEPAAKPAGVATANPLETCTVCHGKEGRASPEGYYPRIAGKPEGYLFNQLKNFKEGRRHSASMGYLVAQQSDDYLQEIARHFSSQHLPYPAPVAIVQEASARDRGRLLTIQGDANRDIPACASCHGDNLMGMSPSIPGLLGLPRDYLNAQLGSWLNGLRTTVAPDCMGHIAKQLSGADINAVTGYLASLPVPPGIEGPTASHLNKKLPMACGSARSLATGKVSTSFSQDVPQSQRASSPQVEQGRYLAKVGNCAGCHTQQGQSDMTGGRAIQTPYGAVYATNLTPAPKTGLGTWTAEDFWNAMHHGVSKTRGLLYPAFPFDQFTNITRTDSDALFAYLRSLPAVENATPEPALNFPYNQRWLLHVWRAIYFTPGQTSVKPNPSKVERGQYLVNGLGHCASCHTPRQTLGGPVKDRPLAGGVIPMVNWYAPPIRYAQSPWNTDDIAQYLQHGINKTRASAGPMGEVIFNSLQALTTQDINAIASYLKSLAALPEPASAPLTARNDPVVMAVMLRGQSIYENQCSTCHGQQGEGVPYRYPALAGNTVLTHESGLNTIHMVLHGGFAPGTTGNPKPYGMPPYRIELSDTDISAVASYIRNAWGNQGRLISSYEIQRYRTPPTR